MRNGNYGKRGKWEIIMKLCTDGSVDAPVCLSHQYNTTNC